MSKKKGSQSLETRLLEFYTKLRRSIKKYFSPIAPSVAYKEQTYK